MARSEKKEITLLISLIVGFPLLLGVVAGVIAGGLCYLLVQFFPVYIAQVVATAAAVVTVGCFSK